MLKMKQGTQWVDLPAELQPTIPTYGEAEYRFLETFVDYQPSGVSGGGQVRRMIFRNEVPLASIFNIRQGNKTVTLGLVGAYDATGTPDGAQITPISFKPQQLGGKLTLYPGRDDHDLAIFQALELHPDVGNNMRSRMLAEAGIEDNGPKVMECVDSAAEATAERSKNALRQKAYAHALGLETEEDVKGVALLMGIESANRGEGLIRADVERAALADPADYMVRVQDPNKDIKADFLLGLRLSLITIDKTSNMLRWKNNNSEILSLTATDNNGAAEQFAAFVKNEANGANIYKSLQNQIADKKLAAKKTAKAAAVA